MTDRDSQQVYAWNWFSLHAGQRLQMVNFWLVATSFMIAAFVQAQMHGLHAISFGISIAGVASSLAFMQLDIRTRQLVHVAEKALSILEKEDVAAGSDSSMALTERANENRTSTASYRVIIQGLEGLIALLFILFAIYSIV